jgi:hypothetical protein
MSKKIDVNQVQIKTANIEIKAITLNSKQMTLAVFKQLQQEGLIDPKTLQLYGIPWGVINYHPDKCSDANEHIHVMWQKGNELRRDIVYKQPCYAHWNMGDIYNALNDTVKDLEIIITKHIQKKQSSTGEYLYFISRYYVEWFKNTLKSVFLNSEDFVDSCIVDGILLKSVPIINETLTCEKEKLSIMGKPWTQLYSTLSNLDQLFIAI